ncbi:MAG: tetratricopeptide repeat protein [Proteobacteria bacterium]|nr:tetratricopeptide repeat protein [Pseudomonadota bacterium]
MAYVLGLIYESLAFFPEAMGNYDRLEFKKGEAKGAFYYKTVLRKSYVKFITGLKYRKLLSMVDADGGFYRVFKNSADEAEWKDALAGHGVMLYFFGAHDSAEAIFESVKKNSKLMPAAQFAQAENYMNMGLHQDARVVFQDLLRVFQDSERTDLLAYIYLRLGDIANIRGETDNALAFYMLIAPRLEEGEEVVFTDPYIIQSMAVGEYFMKTEKGEEAIAIFKMLSRGPMPIGLDLRESIALNITLLYHTEELELKAFSNAKEFALLYPDNAYIHQVKRIINDTIYKFIATVYENHDYHNVLYYYYENMRFVKEKRTLMLVAKVFLDLGFPEDARLIFTKLWNRYPKYTDIELLTGLARSEAMLGEFLKAEKNLRKSRPEDRTGRELVAKSWRLLADDYYRKGDMPGALKSYANVRKTLFDVIVELRYASLLTSQRRAKDAISVYRALLKRSITDDTKGKAYFGAAEAYSSVRSYRKAVINYQFALKLSAKKLSGEINYKIGEANYAMGKLDKALKAWKEAERIDSQGYYKRLAKARIKEVTIWEQARM